jgi:hypothetical protein
MRRKFLLSLVALGIATATVLIGGCKLPPPTKEEMSAYSYGPQPDNYEQLVHDYLKPRIADPASAVLEFRAGPKLLYQQATQLRPLQYGWGVCVLVNEKNKSGGFAGFYPMVFFIRDGKITAVNGGNEDNVIGWRFARTGCQELGFTVP